MKLSQSRAMVATIRYDIRAGNGVHARRVANELFEGDWTHSSDLALMRAIQAIEVKLDEMGM
jgi:hypothetical protein